MHSRQDQGHPLPPPPSPFPPARREWPSCSRGARVRRGRCTFKPTHGRGKKSLPLLPSLFHRHHFWHCLGHTTLGHLSLSPLPPPGRFSPRDTFWILTGTSSRQRRRGKGGLVALPGSRAWQSLTRSCPHTASRCRSRPFIPGLSSLALTLGHGEHSCDATRAAGLAAPRGTSGTSRRPG